MKAVLGTKYVPNTNGPLNKPLQPFHSALVHRYGPIDKGVFRAGTAETGTGNLPQIRRDAQALMNELCAAGSMGPLHGAFALPVFLQGANGQFQVMHQLAVGTAAPQQQPQQPGWPVRV